MMAEGGKEGSAEKEGMSHVKIGKSDETVEGAED